MCGGNFKSMIWAKQHMTKKHRASSEDDQDDKEEKKAWMEEELRARFNENMTNYLVEKYD